MEKNFSALLCTSCLRRNIGHTTTGGQYRTVVVGVAGLALEKLIIDSPCSTCSGNTECHHRATGKIDLVKMWIPTVLGAGHQEQSSKQLRYKSTVEFTHMRVQYIEV